MVKDNGGSFVFFITIAASSTDCSISYLSSVTAAKGKSYTQPAASRGRPAGVDPASFLPAP